MTTLLKAAPVREQALQTLTDKCNELKKSGVTPTLKVILVGEHPPSVIYTRNKKKFMESFGAECEIIKLSEKISEDDFLNEIAKITSDDSVHGCFVQLPLPKQLAHIDVGNLIPTRKDVDGFGAGNLYEMLHGDNGDKSLLPCTPKGIITLLKHYKIELAGKNVVVIGRSMIVGKPMAMLMLNHNATVTVCHSKTKDLASFTKNADIIVSAIGVAKFLGKEHIGNNKPVVIDVGMNQDSNGNLCGDVDLEAIENKCSAITPVPGGVGPMTILSLAENLIQATYKQSRKK